MVAPFNLMSAAQTLALPTLVALTSLSACSGSTESAATEKYPSSPLSAEAFLSICSPISTEACDSVVGPSSNDLFLACSDMRKNAVTLWQTELEKRLPEGKSWEDFIGNRVPWYLVTDHSMESATYSSDANPLPEIFDTFVESGSLSLFFDEPQQDSDGEYTVSSRIMCRSDYYVNGGVDLRYSSAGAYVDQFNDIRPETHSLSRVLSTLDATILDRTGNYLSHQALLFMDQIQFDQADMNYMSYACVPSVDGVDLTSPSEHENCDVSGTHQVILSNAATLVDWARDLSHLPGSETSDTAQFGIYYFSGGG